MKPLVLVASILLAGAPALPAAGSPLCADVGFAGLLAKCNRGAPIAVTLAAGQPLAAGEAVLQSGAYYELHISADGSAELGLSGPEFFRAIWINEVVINDIEVRPMALDSLEFDDAGEAVISFVAIKPGRYTLAIPGSSGESQRMAIRIE